MPRSSWNSNVPDVVGVEFVGVGVATNIIQTGLTMRALRFKPQRSGPVTEVALYSGASTNNPVLAPSYFSGHRKPFLVELYPATGFDPGGVHTITTYPSTITASSNVVDEGGGAVGGNELAQANDGLFLFNSGGTPSQVTVQMAGASAFPLDQHVISVAIEYNGLKSMNVRRIDQSGSFAWVRLFPAGQSVWHMGEAYIESGTTTPWRLWSPSDVRQFASAVGNRRLQLRALNTQSNIMDLMRIHVDSIPEGRAGVAVIEPLGTYQWVLGQMHLPNVTGSPATVVAGQEYIVLVRCPSSASDYGGSGSFDWRSIRDRNPGTGFQHYTFLDWDSRDVTLWETDVQRALGTQLDGLPSLRMLNAGVQVVDTQPYSGSNSGTLPQKADTASSKRPRQKLIGISGSTPYGKARVNMAVLTAPTAPTDRKYVNLDIVNDADTLIAGPFQITEAMVLAGPVVGSDRYGDVYHQVDVPFGSGLIISPAAGVRARFTLASDYGEPGKTNNVWRIGAMVAEVYATGTGDQTADGAATGHAFIAPSNAFVPLDDTAARLSDLQVALLSQPPAITGTSVTILQQPVTGGVCDPCPPFMRPDCAVTGIPYNHVCWSPTTLTQDKFGYYEIQRMETAFMDAEWATVAIIAPTGTPVTGVPASGTVPRCWDDYSHPYDSQVCYQVRQQRADGSFSDFVEQVCLITPSPVGADMIITAPDNPTINVAFPETYGATLPITKDWTNLDADSHIIQAVYGRDKHISFRPLERLGLRFQRRLLVSALCTPMAPCLNVIEGIHEICHAHVGYLVVRDRCGNRWYATVAMPSFTQVHDPDVGDFWLVDVVVTELATPIISVDTV